MQSKQVQATTEQAQLEELSWFNVPIPEIYIGWEMQARYHYQLNPCVLTTQYRYMNPQGEVREGVIKGQVYLEDLQSYFCAWADYQIRVFTPKQLAPVAPEPVNNRPVRICGKRVKVHSTPPKRKRMKAC